ncbi:acyltransferase family protein [Alienimonas californiensis]|uniref:Glucans biosynthesis protein n=1 Tax=Alienimonas californiensis TaxID=2527989 RepID=A0A517PAC7_9PLAN|nr:acyltransferase [Alienimonas californiensis]QDT16326.1 glucans biosynthesis protein [Alienimonas californiensis]
MSARTATLPLFPVAPATAVDDGRMPGFERVRAAAMLLVVAFHAALPYACGELPGLLWTVPVGEESAGLLADPLFWTAEAIIMPLFFGMSGFWSARLGQRGDVAGFVSGRVRRVFVPLVVGVATVVTASLVIWVVSLPLTGRLSWDEFRELDLPGSIEDVLWGPSHLWYLQFLFLWALFQIPLDALAAAADRGEEPLVARVLGRLDAIMRTGWRWTLPTAGLAVVLAVEPEIYLGFQHQWFPHPAKFLHAGVCFLFGWLCWRNRASLATAGSTFLPLTLAAAAAAVPLVLTVREAVLRDGSERGFVLPAALCAGLATTAALVHGASSRRPAGRIVTALAGASFWIYIVHQPLVGSLHLGLWFVDAPPDLEFAAVFCVALGLTWAAEPLSRRTRWGQLVTGRSRPAADSVLPTAEPQRRVA